MSTVDELIKLQQKPLVTSQFATKAAGLQPPQANKFTSENKKATLVKTQ